jgi:hypothetical protein
MTQPCLLYLNTLGFKAGIFSFTGCYLNVWGRVIISVLWFSSHNITVGSGDLRQMREYLIPHGEHYHSYILRRWRPAFLHPKEEIQSDRSATELMRKMLPRLFPSPNKGPNYTSSPKKACEMHGQ